MATVALISITDYLKDSYRPDQELLEGQLVERNLGEYDHSNLQGMLVFWLGRHQREWKIRVLPAQRLRVSPTRFRIPDVCVISREQEIEPVFTKPPLLVIERIDDYRALGIPNIWVLDPVKRRAYICTQGDFHEPETKTLEVPGSPIFIPIPDSSLT